MTARAARALALATAALVLTACGGSGEDASLDAGGSSSPTPNANGCTPVPSAAPTPQHFDAEPKLTIDKTTYTATIVTNCGTIVAELDGKKAPHTVNSFAFLAGKHYFDDTPCHRLTTSGIFVLQCGDPTGTGTGDPGYSIPDENLAGAKYPAGTIAMANAGPDTGGSQFFVVYADTQLPPSYTPFGTIVDGLDVVQRVAKAGSDDSNGAGDGAPRQPVVIESFTVDKSG